MFVCAALMKIQSKITVKQNQQWAHSPCKNTNARCLQRYRISNQECIPILVFRTDHPSGRKTLRERNRNRECALCCDHFGHPIFTPSLLPTTNNVRIYSQLITLVLILQDFADYPLFRGVMRIEKKPSVRRIFEKVQLFFA